MVDAGVSATAPCGRGSAENADIRESPALRKYIRKQWRACVGSSVQASTMVHMMRAVAAMLVCDCLPAAALEPISLCEVLSHQAEYMGRHVVVRGLVVHYLQADI
jgi:hypothetical protein